VGEQRYMSDGASDMWHYLKGRSDVIQKKGEPSLSFICSTLTMETAGVSEMTQTFNCATQCHMPCYTVPHATRPAKLLLSEL